MVSKVPEADWKIFRELRERALERLCDRILEELVRATADRSKTAHERYLAVYELLHERDRAIAQAFDNPRRSAMHVQLAAIDELGLLESDDLTRMTSETQEWLRVQRGLRRTMKDSSPP